MPGAYYNEIDPKAAAWLRELIRRNLIAPGDVDERSIEDVRPDDLSNYTQCHFFAGIGVWSYALRRAGWPDDRPVWTGSCPCQPFSQAGKGAGTADERHLWPAFFHLIRARRPQRVYGEQVASKAGRGWLATVQDDLEGVGYFSFAADLCAAGVGAPHIRQRIYWMAVANYGQRGRGPVAATGHDRRGADAGRSQGGAAARREDGCGLADDDAGRLEHTQRYGESERRLEARARRDDAGRCSELGDSGGGGSGRHSGTVSRAQGGIERGVRREPNEPQFAGADGELAHHQRNGRGEERSEHRGVIARDRTEGLPARLESGRSNSELADTDGRDSGAEREQRSREHGLESQDGRAGCGQLGDDDQSGLERRRVSASGRSGQRTPWSPSDFVWCRDGKWRPVEPGSFPLAHGSPARVGRLRGYGNAIVAPLAQAFIEATDE